MDVLPRLEGLDQARVVGQVGDHPELDLVVVGDQQRASLGGDEGATELAPLLAADRDVVEVGLIRRQPARPGDGLVEAGVDAPVGGDLGEEAVAVGRAQLLHLPVAQEGVHDGVLAPEALQGPGVGGVTGLGLLLGGQTELVEQDRPQLRRRVDPEGRPGKLLDLLVETLDLVGERPHH